jgi:hypothetical protein
LWEKKQNWMGIAIDLYANGRCANQKPHLVKTCGWIATSLRFEKERDNE